MNLSTLFLCRTSSSNVTMEINVYRKIQEVPQQGGSHGGGGVRWMCSWCSGVHTWCTYHCTDTHLPIHTSPGTSFPGHMLHAGLYERMGFTSKYPLHTHVVSDTLPSPYTRSIRYPHHTHSTHVVSDTLTIHTYTRSIRYPHHTQVHTYYQIPSPYTQ